MPHPVRAQSANPDPAFDQTITVPELLEKAREAFGLGDLVLAELFYQEILRREPTHAQAMLELANVYERSGRLEYARGLLIRAAKLKPSDERIATRRENVDRMLYVVLRAEVDELMASARYEDAIPRIALQLTISPEDGELYYRRATCLARLGRQEAAMADVGRAIQLDPQQSYYDLRAAIVRRLQQVETKDLKKQARALIQEDTPRSRDAALDILADILTMEPDDTWARAMFLSLTDTTGTVAANDTTGTAAAATGRGASGVLISWAESAGHHAVLGARWFARLAEQYLGLILAFVAVALVFRSPLTRALSRRLTRPPILAGELDAFELSEVMLMLNAEPHSGALSVHGKTCRGTIYFESGEPCHCVVGRLEGSDALTRLLTDAVSGRFTFSHGRMPTHRTIDTPLSLVLFEHARDTGRTKPRKAHTTQKSRMRELLDSRKS